MNKKFWAAYIAVLALMLLASALGGNEFLPNAFFICVMAGAIALFAAVSKKKS